MLRDVVHFASVAVVIFFVLLFLIGSGIYLFHVMGPPCRRWLSAEDLQTMHTIGSSAVLAMVVSELGRKIATKIH